MESETFKMRKRFLGNFLNKNRVEFLRRNKYWKFSITQHQI